MSRLPTVGGDDGSWGEVLNEYLSVAHNLDGTLKLAPDIASALERSSSALDASQQASQTATEAKASASQAAMTAEAAQASAAQAQTQIRQYPDPTNVAALAPFQAKLLMCRRQKVTVTCVTDSIGWGVGTDGQPASTTGALSPQNDIYRENAWPYQLGSILNMPYGLPSVIGWLGPGYSTFPSSWAAATDASLSTNQASQGPFGSQSGGNHGGAQLRYAGYIEWNSDTLTRPFTELDVLVFAGPEFTDAAYPSVLIDGVKVYTGAPAPTGVANQLSVFTVTGLTNTTHVVRLVNDVASKNVYGCFIVPRNHTGVVVNRIGSPGATSADAVAAGRSYARVIPSTVLPGYSDLVVIALSTNDYIYQTPLADFKNNIQALITAAGSGTSILLLDGPPVNTVTNEITPPQYMKQLLDLANSNSNVAFAPLSALFGPRDDAVARGLFATHSTVHPSWTGANLIADYLAYILHRSYGSF